MKHLIYLSLVLGFTNLHGQTVKFSQVERSSTKWSIPSAYRSSSSTPQWMLKYITLPDLIDSLNISVGGNVDTVGTILPNGTSPVKSALPTQYFAYGTAGTTYGSTTLPATSIPKWTTVSPYPSTGKTTHFFTLPTPTNNKVLKANGTDWIAQDDNAGITSINGQTGASQTIGFGTGLAGATVGVDILAADITRIRFPSPVNNKVIKANGTDWIAQDDATGITSLSTTNGITGGTITTSGTIGLTGQALAVHNLGTNGLIARTASGTVAARTIAVAGGNNAGLTISNGDGVSGNPTIGLPAGSSTGQVIKYTVGSGWAAGTDNTSTLPSISTGQTLYASAANTYTATSFNSVLGQGGNTERVEIGSASTGIPSLVTGTTNTTSGTKLFVKGGIQLVPRSSTATGIIGIDADNALTTFVPGSSSGIVLASGNINAQVINNAHYQNTGDVSQSYTAVNTPIVVSMGSSAANGNITTSGNALSIPSAGTYLLTYSGQVNPPTGCSVTIGLYRNGSIIAGSEFIVNSSTIPVSRSFIATLASSSTVDMRTSISGCSAPATGSVRYPIFSAVRLF